MAARGDQNKYPACCLTMENARPLVVGGATWREGTQFVAETKTVTDHQEKRLIDFVASRTAAYVLEFGHEYVRFFRNGAALFAGASALQLSMMGQGLPFEEPLPPADGVISAGDRLQLVGAFALVTIGEVTSPYADTDLAAIITVQSIDVMYLFHKDYPVHKITRISESEFLLTEVNFNPPALIEEEPSGADLGAGTLTPGATTGTGVTFTIGAATLLAGDEGRIIVSGASRAQIVTVAGTSITVDIIDDFISTAVIAADDWRLTGSPNTTIDVTDKRTETGQVVTLHSRGLDGTGDLNAFRSTDVGKYVVLFGGTVRIDSFVDASHVKGTIVVPLQDIDVNDPVATPAWTIEVPAWSAELGYPSCGTFFQGRLYVGKGLTVNGSVTGDFENFGKGSGADDAIARTIDDDDVDAIVWMKGDQSLKVATGSGIYECSPTSQNGALTPSSFKVVPIDPNGGTSIAPVRVMPVLIYVDASTRTIRELAYDFASDKFKSPNLFRLAEHLVEGFFITELFHTKDPDSIIYARRNDGVLMALVYEQSENVIGWYRITTDGDIKSGCSIPRPSTGKDWVWVIVERDNGIFVEYFEPDHPTTGRDWNDLQTDSAVITAHDANFLVSGLDHLEGQTVKVIGDGMLFEDAVVENGALTLDPQYSVSTVEVGLHYDARIVPVEPALPAEAGGPLIARGYAEVGIVIRRALGLTLRAFRVNMTEPGDDTIVGEQLVYRKPYHDMDAHVPLQQGKKCILNLGYDPFARIEISRSLPFPAEILNVIGRLHVGDRWDCDTYNDTPTESNPFEGPPPEPPVEICIPPTQEIVQIDTLGPDAVIPGAQAIDWSYVQPNEPDGEIIQIAWVNYFLSPPIKFYTLTDGVVTSEVPYTPLLGEFDNTLLIGRSERPIWHSHSVGPNRHVLIFPEEGNRIVRLLNLHPNAPLGPFQETGTMEMFTAFGENFIMGLTTDNNLNHPGEYLIRWEMVDESEATAFAEWTAGYALKSLHDNGNFLYALAGNIDPCVIFQYDRISLELLDTISLPAGAVFDTFFVEDDNLIWLLQRKAVNEFALGYWRDSAFTYVDESITRTGGNDGQLYITNYADGSRYYYLGYHASGGIGKYGPIVCP